MNVLVTILGVLAILIGLIGLIRPGAFVAMITVWNSQTRFWFAILFRFVIGMVLVLVAQACRFPLAVQFLGGITITAGLIILIAGRSRLDATIHWWTTDKTKLRFSSLFAIVIGVLFVYVAG